VADFLMPSLGADMDEGTLVEWQVKPGDTVRRAQVVAVVETAKGAIDVEIFQDGVIEALLVEEGTTVPVGQPIARLSQAAVDEAAVSGPQTASPRLGDAPAAMDHPAPPQAAASHARASPAARRRAMELGLALEGIEGSGPEGAITLSDIEAVGAQLTPTATSTSGTGAKPAATMVAPAGAAAPGLAPRSPDMRAIIATAMTKSKREIPHYYLGDWINLTRANEWLADWNASHPVEERLLPAVLMIRAVALAARRYPEFNGHYRNNAFVPADGVHVGNAISLRRGGLIAPALRDADQRTLPELMAGLRDLVMRARTGRLTGSEIAGGTITISSLGDQGVEELFPVIYAPQVAIVGVGTPVERPWVSAGRVEPCWLVRITLAADHRVSDGHRGALFLDAISRLMQDPESL
jgi:pyruvate dehydrogenase E2 component (dihydrolipoamide acetyltransferase)